MSYINKKILFVLKEKYSYGTEIAAHGLYNACDFVKRKLVDYSVTSNIVQVDSENAISTHIENYQPNFCFIEAIWVSPEKINELTLAYPHVVFIIRLHSLTPFLAVEGNAFAWIYAYSSMAKTKNNLSIACNSRNMCEDINSVYNYYPAHIPNIYYPNINVDPDSSYGKRDRDRNLNIGCFGALRILKNHTQQAVWAVEFANKNKKHLYFHINVPEYEQLEGSPILNNLRAIFNGSIHTLVEHTWYGHEQFLELVKTMDFGMQISFTETFNIVAADFVHCNIPIVTSKDIPFINRLHKVDLNDKSDVMWAMWWANRGRLARVHKLNNLLLESHNERATEIWLRVIS
jgi:hypothetical protein